MKKIIAGQLMLWANIGSLILGYYLINQFQIVTYIEVMASLIGVLSTGFNCIYAVTIQIKGYKELDIEP
jgi:hypothetical protein